MIPIFDITTRNFSFLDTTKAYFKTWPSRMKKSAGRSMALLPGQMARTAVLGVGTGLVGLAVSGGFTALGKLANDELDRRRMRKMAEYQSNLRKEFNHPNQEVHHQAPHPAMANPMTYNHGGY